VLAAYAILLGLDSACFWPSFLAGEFRMQAYLLADYSLELRSRLRTANSAVTLHSKTAFHQMLSSNTATLSSKSVGIYFKREDAPVQRDGNQSQQWYTSPELPPGTSKTTAS
jgi:hypothetical protein